MPNNFIFGSIQPVEPIIVHSYHKKPMSFQGKIADKLLMPKKAQIPFIVNQSVCSFIDDPNGMSTYIYNSSDDTWTNSTDPNDVV